MQHRAEEALHVRYSVRKCCSILVIMVVLGVYVHVAQTPVRLSRAVDACRAAAPSSHDSAINREQEDCADQ